MAESTKPTDDNGFFHSLNCIDIWIEGPGDTTVRPIPPERLAQAKAERDRIYGAKGNTPQPPLQEAT